MKPHGLVLYAASLDKGVEFYKTLLGVSPKILEPERGFAQFDLNGFELIIHEIPRTAPDKPDEQISSRPPPVFELEADPDQFHQRLSASRFETPRPPTDRNYGLRQLNVQDPDGNKLAIVKPIS